jgi:hypothetical protein
MCWWNFNAKIEPDRIEVKKKKKFVKSALPFRLVNLETVDRRYGGRRRPRIDPYDVLRDSGELVEWRCVPVGSTVIYISHEWTGTGCPDHDGTQWCHLLQMLKRLRGGEISRTDMDPMHSLIYKHNKTTTADEWKRMLNPEKTFLWYDGFCVPRSRREDCFRSIPAYIQLCDFMIVLAPGCTHFDRINPRTQRKMNLCYRTYRIRAHCVFELFCVFLTTRGRETTRPALLVRSGTGTPNWISPLECQKLAVGTSTFECCETNHTTIKQCLKSVVQVLLEKMIKERTENLFKFQEFALARFHKTLSVWWLRGFSFHKSSPDSVSSSKLFRQHLHWENVEDGMWFDRCGISIFSYVVVNNNILVLRELLNELETNEHSLRAKRLRGEVPAQGLTSLGLTGKVTTLMLAMGLGSTDVVSLLLEQGADPYVRY